LKINIKRKDNQQLLSALPEHRQDSMLLDWFEADFWRGQNKIVGQSKGRHITWFIQPPAAFDESEWVLRHYYRGGMIAKLIYDQFLYTGIRRTRSFREITLLNAMRELALPVPKPIGARVLKSGLFYRADLLMEKIDARDLVAHLTRSPLSAQVWQQIGRVIGRFHQQGIYHSDLNARNILIDPEHKIWLIDFDRCEMRVPKSKWQQQNLQRLQRSLIKEKSLSNSLHFEQSDWDSLLLGYRKGD